MTKVSSCLVGIGMGLLLSAAHAQTPAEQVRKDTRGRVIARDTTNPDKSSRHTSFQYRADSVKPHLIVEEDLDPLARVVARLEQRFDDDGRLALKIETAIDAAGKRTSKRTLYSYDAAGKRLEQVAPAE